MIAVTILAAVAVLLGIEVTVLNVMTIKRLDWLRRTLIPWMTNISDHINPDHDTLPGDNPPNIQ